MQRMNHKQIECNKQMRDGSLFHNQSVFVGTSGHGDYLALAVRWPLWEAVGELLWSGKGERNWIAEQRQQQEGLWDGMPATFITAEFSKRC